MSKALDAVPSDMCIAMRHAITLLRDFKQLEEETLISGAMPSEFKIVHTLLVRGQKFGTRIE